MRTFLFYADIGTPHFERLSYHAHQINRSPLNLYLMLRTLETAGHHDFKSSVTKSEKRFIGTSPEPQASSFQGLHHVHTGLNALWSCIMSPDCPRTDYQITFDCGTYIFSPKVLLLTSLLPRPETTPVP